MFAEHKPAGCPAQDPALDSETSGVQICRVPQRVRVRRRFLAVVEGRLAERTGVFRAPQAGRVVPLRYTVRARGRAWSLIELGAANAELVRLACATARFPIRGDMLHGDALDVRASRLLLHCATVWVGERRIHAPPPAAFARYTGEGDGRAALAADPDTTCYRACNGAADGHPGWVVDRYADWAWVQAAAESGPLPTGLRGVFRIDAQPDRSRGQQAAPRLVDGEAPPPDLPVLEAGVRYRALLGPQLSTGLFLDQRPQRAWLRRHAGGMRVLNTFAHAGGFSIAAACAGAETVSIDLSRMWLERIPPMLVDNGVDPAAHDQIYGDVFDWVRRLANRKEQFDLVILDPPSTSVGKKKKRWSAARDYPELVRLAAPLVAPGGALWTATNHRQISPKRFVHLVGSAAPVGAQLERVCPPAVDFPTDGPAPVKTHVWRWPR